MAVAEVDGLGLRGVWQDARDAVAEASARLGREVTVAPYPQFTGALGAALMARRQHTADEDVARKAAGDS